ncbi:MAG: SpoIIE family protein phosphatase [Phycisphaerae bacterium]|nr:SpoIIE family protein phosphatase [Phycisphaerae bacterium]
MSKPHEVGIKAEDWQRIRVVLERLAASSDTHEVLGLIIDSVRDCLHADRASVFQYDKGTHELFATKAHGVDQNLRFSANAGLAGEAVRTGSIINVPDCYADPRFNRAIDQKTGFRTRCMLTIPLISFDGGLEGVAQVLNKDTRFGEVFDATDESTARALASQAAVALKRARLMESERQMNKLEADLAIARTIQQSTLPKSLPAPARFDVAASSFPAEETGGDAYDVTLYGEGDRKLLVFMADATGHGIGPALSVTQVHAMLRMGIRMGGAPSTLATHLNAQLCQDLPAGRFVTVFLGELDLGTARMEYVSAGQAPLLIVRADGSFENLNANAMPFGIDADTPPDPVPPIELRPGDCFLLLSDGYFEAQDPSGEMLGIDRVVRVAHAMIHEPAGRILDAINAELASFVRGHPAADDQTAIVIRFKP